MSLDLLHTAPRILIPARTQACIQEQVVHFHLGEQMDDLLMCVNQRSLGLEQMEFCDEYFCRDLAENDPHIWIKKRTYFLPETSLIPPKCTTWSIQWITADADLLEDFCHSCTCSCITLTDLSILHLPDAVPTFAQKAVLRFYADLQKTEQEPFLRLILYGKKKGVKRRFF